MSEEMNVPKLTLNLTPETPEEQPVLNLAKVEDTVKIQEFDKLSDEEKKIVDDFYKQIDLTNNNIVLLYGSSAQKEIADFSDTALNSIRTKDMGEVGTILTNLVVELKNFNDETEEKQGGFLGIFKSAKQNVAKIKTSYTKVEANVAAITESLQKHQTVLLKDSAMLDKMYNENKKYFKELSMYIAAGEKKLAEFRANEIVAARNKAAQTGEMMDAQYVNDLTSMGDRFEKKLHDLKLTRQVSLQMAPQIRLLQNNDTMLVEKIQSSIVNTIPLWKSQMVMALGLSNSENAMKAQRQVTDLTNQMLLKNAEMLKIGTVEIAKEAERGIIDIETLKQTNQALITTFDEVIKIQDEGRDKRAKAETELRAIEGELKSKLLAVKK